MFCPENRHYANYEFHIREILGKYLPGEKAQFRMAPVERPTKEADHKTRNAGVMLLLFPGKDGISTILIQRQVYEGVHSGQISLPGGKQEKHDINITDTALRETQEEIGIHRNDVKILGKLTPLYIPVSNFLVQPVIGSLSYKPKLEPDIREVEKVYTVNLKTLADPTCVKNEIFIENNKTFNAPFYKVENLNIWGATAMILSEFIELHTEVLTNSLQ